MDKLSSIKDYMTATKAYYLFWFGKYYNNESLQQFILDKKNIIGAKIAIISNIMLGVKEDLVENLGERNYQSKVFINALEDGVSYIATKVSNGYKIGDYIFPDAETLVAIIRNKMAHGNFKIDFEHGRVIINHQGNDIILSVYKLSTFIANALRMTIGDVKTTKYERDMVSFTDMMVANRKEPLKTPGEIKRVIKGFEHISFKLESLDGKILTDDLLAMVEELIHYVNYNFNTYKNSDYYKRMCRYFEKNNCKLTIESKRLTDPNDVNEILELLKPEILGDSNGNLHSQIEGIGLEFHRKINPNLNNFNPIASNIKHLIMLDALYKKNTTDTRELSQYVTDNITDGNEMRFYYDEYGILLISMFNSFFIYPFDDIYDIDGGYKLDRSDGLDFSKLDLSMLDVTYIDIDETPLLDAKNGLDSIVNKQVKISKKIIEQRNNLTKVSGNQVAINNINSNIASLNNSLVSLITDYSNQYSLYNSIKDDFTNNRMYFKNKAIIEGIRNSIAHGNYEFLIGRDFNDTTIIFSDIYEGKLTFQAKIKFIDFEKLFDVNTNVLVKFIDKKLGITDENSLTRK
ncbi:MAG: hypothetical protein IJE89_01130 [Bacilli bacterium]|nr:hypothetical protein [Bacilli bacterium]